ncbi:glycoprotein 3-alpha-L-fucosyltransferase A [Octopus bimaculoides]|uniref:Fucosyltransferase n=1 Tax=Octopus bimaculoides TaxID=37653 RepID=A0A0L8GJB7_OCTBM|nr:glycoprotein 3-alpha-L-fucosyltransferase A [Octopus bimaculoides]|eukprot:XP_014780591.1 PREDICTED: glycoprotein 3-alpha-L-fucosyltransferase A-like [Octopus bimaculoides]
MKICGRRCLVFVFFITIITYICFLLLQCKSSEQLNIVIGIQQPVSYVSYSSLLIPGQQSDNDRMTAQLKYVLSAKQKRGNDKRNVAPNQSEAADKIRQKFKTLLIYNLKYLRPLKENQESFLEYGCPVNECLVTNDKAKQNSVDAIFFYETVGISEKPKHSNQIWIYMTQECPNFNPSVKHLENRINWTITYRQDSTIVYPYGKFQYFKKSVTQKTQSINYARGKTKKVAWFTSSCCPSNDRMGYAKELGKYIQVDIYGNCGTKVCEKRDKWNCFQMLQNEYKFYLAFENSNCRDYITEKFFINALQHNTIPIVMGAHPDDYREVAPENSYIHYEDFKTAKELAAYLHKLDQNDILYNEYFKWKGTGEFVHVQLWCHVCAMLHHALWDKKPIWYENLGAWWAGKGMCIGKDRWT